MNASAANPSADIRIPVHASDPPAVFQLVAKLLMSYREEIERDVDRIVGACGPDSAEAAAAYIAEIGSNIPDATIKAAVKRLAAAHFRMRGIEANNGGAKWAQQQGL